MADKLQLEDGSGNLELEGTTDDLLLEDVTAAPSSSLRITGPTEAQRLTGLVP